jgi:signal transduction histidine kinase
MLAAQRLLAGLRGIDRRRADALVGLLLAIEVELQVWLNGSGVRSALGGVVLSLAVAFRRRWSVQGVLAVLAIMAVQAALGVARYNHQNQVALIPGLLLLFYGLGAFASERKSLWTLGLALAVVSVNSATKPDTDVGTLLGTDLFGVLLPWALGRMLRGRSTREREYREIVERLDAGRELHAHEAAYGERARIARELHDVIAHSVSVMVIQAGAARMVMDREADRAEASLRAVERAGGDALAEMRRLLGVVDGEQDLRALAPQPGLADLGELLSRTRASGLATDLLVDGEPTAVSPALDLCAYRIVQEALTNAIKHAGPASAEVRLRWAEDALELEISDDGRGPVAPDDGGGHGIAGMGERAALHGGSIYAGASARGGFTVRARLPLVPELVA